MIAISGLTKRYASGREALKNVSLEIRKGEIFALLGPNGAGKTTLINIVCGIVTPSAGSVRVDGKDILRDYRATRAMIGLVPQELTTDTFETVIATVTFSRGLFGRPASPSYVEQVLRQLSLWERNTASVTAAAGPPWRKAGPTISICTRWMSRPSTRTSPALGRTMPQTMLISVVLPAPFGPSSAKISPLRISRSTCFSACWPDA